MTARLFNEWLVIVDKQMANQKKKIALIVDNCTAHNLRTKLTNIELIYLPPNCTSILQPLDMGIIRCFKAYYRRRLVEKVLFNIEYGASCVGKVDVKDACDEISNSWNEVTAKTISNCWRKAGFNSTVEVDDIDESVAMENLQKSLQNLPGSAPAEEYVSVDDELHVFAEFTDEEIVQEVKEDLGESGKPDDDDDNDECPTERNILSNNDAITAVENLKIYFSSLPEIDAENFHFLDKLRGLCVQNFYAAKKQQTKITSFFT